MSATPIKHDGWRSRKVLVGLVVLAVLIVIATAAMFWPEQIATFDQWSGFMQILVPSVLVPLFGAMGWELRERRVLAQNGNGAG